MIEATEGPGVCSRANTGGPTESIATHHIAAIKISVIEAGVVEVVAVDRCDPLLLRRAWREVLEHFVHAFIQILDVLVGIVGKCVA